MPDSYTGVPGLLPLSSLGSTIVPEASSPIPGLLSDLGKYISPSNQEWAPWPVRAVRSTLSALGAPGDAYSGRLPMTDSSGHTSLDAIGRATDLAGLMTLGAGAAPAESGAVLNAGLTGLRKRYMTSLMEAAPDKDISRIKLTPERLEIAKAALQRSYSSPSNLPFGAGTSPYRETQQAQLAADFAKQARQVTDDVRVKFPEGPRGSVYVRVGDHGTVRFADHLPPVENGQIVGGYSRDLGRRHYPATVDVSRGKYDERINPAPAYDFIAKLLSGNAT